MADMNQAKAEVTQEKKEEDIPFKGDRANMNSSDGTSSTKESQSVKEKNVVSKKKKVEKEKDKSKPKKRVTKKASDSKKKVKKRYTPPIVFNCLYTQYEVIKEVAEELGWKLSYDDNDEFDVFWSDLPCSTEKLSKMKNYQKLNHFPSMYQICRKNLLAKNLKKMEKMFPSEYKITPKTWIMPHEYSELKAFVTQKKVVSMIVKPEASAQGRGIFITRRLDDINSSEHCVVQRYMRSPYLIDGFKFDLRLYVLVLSCDPLRIFIYEEGMVRFATDEWDIESGTNYNNLHMHLTNYAINKENNFVMADDPHEDAGHKRLYSTVLKRLEKEGVNTKELVEKIDDMIVKTLISAQPELSHYYRTCQPSDLEGNM